MSPDTAAERVVEFPDNRLLIDLCGAYDAHLAAIEKSLEVQIIRRGNHLQLLGDGDAIEKAETMLNALYARLDRSVCVRRTERHRHGARRSRLREEAPGSSVAAGSRRAHHHHGWLVHRAFGLGTVCGGAVLRTRVVRPPRPCRHVCLPTRSLSRGP